MDVELELLSIFRKLRLDLELLKGRSSSVGGTRGPGPVCGERVRDEGGGRGVRRPTRSREREGEQAHPFKKNGRSWNEKRRGYTPSLGETSEDRFERVKMAVEGKREERSRCASFTVDFGGKKWLSRRSKAGESSVAIES